MTDQYLELILNVMPLSQLLFVFVGAVVFDQIENNNAISVVSSMNALGLKSFFSIEEGLFWNVNVVLLGATFFLAILNTSLIKRGLKWSFTKSKVSEKLLEWSKAASSTIKELSHEERAAMQKSISIELDKRMKKYQGKRILAESMCSIVSCIIFGSLYLAYVYRQDFSNIGLSTSDIGVCFLSLFAWFLLHRHSVQYAVSKVIPLQVYLTTVTGEIAFFNFE